MQPVRAKLTYANVVSTLCLFLLLGGGAAWAAGGLARNSVGTKQLRKNAVTAAKIRRGAVTAAKVDVAGLATVPSAQTAATLTPSEPWHVLGAAGEPQLLNGWRNAEGTEPVAFLKDREEIVHLRGVVRGGEDKPIFILPAGFRPAQGRFIEVPMPCEGCGNDEVEGGVIFGTGISAAFDGAVYGGSSESLGLDSITFKAGS